MTSPFGLTAPLASQPALPSTVTPEGASREKFAKTAAEFEAVFLGEMSKLMLESVDMGEEFSGGHAEEVFRGMLAEKLGGEIARRGGVGLAPSVMEQMIKMQESSK